jgi:uncharacterized protein (DUF952 family)
VIYHIVGEADFRANCDDRRYLPADFGEWGFVHCAPEESVVAVANDYYAGVTGTLLLLRIDADALAAPTKYESAAPSSDAGSSHLATAPLFPHVYGPIDLAAITGVGVLAKGPDGYVWPPSFAPLRSVP